MGHCGGGAGLGLGGSGTHGVVDRSGFGGASVRVTGGMGARGDGDEGEDSCAGVVPAVLVKHWVTVELLVEMAMALAMAVTPPGAVADAAACVEQIWVFRSNPSKVLHVLTAHKLSISL